MAKAYCPNCDAPIVVDKPHEGATVTCRECGEALEVVSVNPFEIDFPLDDDWDDDDWDDDWEDDWEDEGEDDSDDWEDEEGEDLD
jgi:lysine biosynthesis protein LysW